MTPHHFGIYNGIPSVNGHLIAIPDASFVSEAEEILALAQKKSISRFGDDIEYPCDLVMTDCDLVDDLIDLDCYLLLLASRESVADKNTKYWDASLDLAQYKLLGWTISDYLGGNYAFCDGVFPIRGLEIDCSDKYELQVVDKDSVNMWGLIKNEIILEEYLQKNKRASVKYFNHGLLSDEIKIDWKSYGVFCDEYTFAKIFRLNSR